MSASEVTPISEADQLWLIARITRRAIGRAVRAAGLAAGTRGLDAGCGAGCHLGLLARQVGPGGHVTALDLSTENLSRARAAWAEAPLSPRGTPRRGAIVHGTAPGAARAAVDFVQGDIRRLPFADESFDWVWCADTLWPGVVVDDPLPVVREFRRVTKPGGKVCLFYWSTQTLLPGYPGLEARLNEAFTEWVPYLAGVPAEAHFLGARAWLREAGLSRPRAQTFLAEVEAPTDASMRESLAMCYAMFWGELEGRVAPEDWAAYRRLCLSDSPGFIADTPDYYAFATYTLFSAVR